MGESTPKTERAVLSPEQFLLLTRNLPERLLLVGQAGDVLAANPAAEEALGRGHLVGTRIEAPELLRLCARSLSPVPGRVQIFSDAYRSEGFRLSRASDAMVFRFWDAEEEEDPFLALRQRIGELTNEVVRRKGSEARLELLLETRERFLGILGHDLRNPLNVISMGATQLLRRSPRSEDEHRTVARIAASADRMDRMIRDLLDFARASFGGGTPISPERCDLDEICAIAVQEQEILHPDRSIRFQREGGLTGLWDRDRLLQAIANLLGNALKHGDDPIEVNLRRAAGGGVVEVANRGTVPPEVWPWLFEPFRTGGRRGSGGLGLGLYIVREIVRAHGGRVEGASEGGRTRFTVWLPPESEATVGR